MFKDEAEFEKIVGGFNIDNKPNPVHREKLRRQMLSAFGEAAKQSATQATVFQTLRRTIMHSPIVKLAAAAVIIIAAMIGAHQFLKPDDTDVTMVDVAKVDNGTSEPIYTGTPELVEIEIKLPKPMFKDTPEDHRVPNLEKPLGRPRPPFLAPVGTKNVALGKPVSGSDEEPIIGEMDIITDGDKEASDGSYVELGPFTQQITIDLEAEHEIYAIVLWHYHKQPRVYFDVVVQVADDPDFISNVRTLFNNDIDNSSGLGVGKNMHYTETHEGKLINAKGIKARYVRLYSNGSTGGNDLNHYIEVEVYGKPAAPPEKLEPLDIKPPKPSYIY